MTATARQRARLRTLGSPLADEPQLAEDDAREAIRTLERLLPPTPAMRERALRAGVKVTETMTRGDIESQLSDAQYAEAMARTARQLRQAIARLESLGATLPEALIAAPARFEQLAQAPPSDDDEEEEFETDAEAIEAVLEEWEAAWNEATEDNVIEWEAGPTKVPPLTAWTLDSLSAWQLRVSWAREAMEAFDSEYHRDSRPDLPRKATKAQMRRAAKELLGYAASGELESHAMAHEIFGQMVQIEVYRDAVERVNREVAERRSELGLPPKDAHAAGTEAPAEPAPKRSWWRTLFSWD